MLMLIVREQYVVFINYCIEIVIYFIDEVYGVGYMCCFFNLFMVVLFSLCVSNVVSNCIVK